MAIDRKQRFFDEVGALRDWTLRLADDVIATQMNQLEAEMQDEILADVMRRLRSVRSYLVGRTMPTDDDAWEDAVLS